MDPIAATSFLGALLGLVDITTRSINKSSVFRTRYRQANLFVSALLGHLCTIKAALTQLAEFQRCDVGVCSETAEELSLALGDSLDGFGILVSSIEEQLDGMGTNDDGQLSVKGRLSFLWHDEEVKDRLNVLDRQVNALNLLLQVMQW
ncbi:MAG: hypothetical protein Q9162_004739 [Coniocarpon cinnabarinum]